METIQVTGERALAFGALAAGVGMVTSYPGSPGTGTVQALIETARDQDLYVEWSANERVALEMAIGASMAGQRALVCIKSVGMNVMVDPLMVLNLTGVNAGLVILLGDDPGAYGSQNDQDTRPLAPFLEMPMIEPSTPKEGTTIMKEAFSLSERFNTAVIIRITRSFAQQVEEIELPEKLYRQLNLGLQKERYRFVPYPGNAVEMHINLHARVRKFETWANNSSLNQIQGSGPKGILAAGFVAQKLLDIMGGEPHTEEFQIFKLSTLYPLPSERLKPFLENCAEILVLEENEPYVEIHLQALAHQFQLGTRILGKQSGHVNREGELFRWQIQLALAKFLPGFTSARNYLHKNESQEHPVKENYCGGYPFEKIIDLIEEVGQELKQQPVLIGDPGCLVAMAERLDGKFAIGSSVAVADGINKVSAQNRAIALFGDSSFFHSTLPAICNAVANRSDILMLLLDNGSTVSTGFQPHPGVGVNAWGNPVPKLDIARIATACGVDFVRTIDAEAPDEALKLILKEAWTFQGLGLLIIQKHVSFNG